MARPHPRRYPQWRTEARRLRRQIAELKGRLAGASPTLDQPAPLPATDGVWQDILDHVPAIVFVKDHKGRYLLVNRVCERLLGLHGEQILGKTTQEILPPELAHQFLANDRRVFATQAPQTVEEIIPQPDGPHTFESLQFPLRGAKGDCYAICGISTDITARKRAERQARETTDQLQSLFANMPIGMFKSTTGGQFVFINPAFATMLGFDSPAAALASINPRSIAEAIYEDPSRRPLLVGEVTQGPGTWKTYANRYRRRDGSVFDAILTLSEQVDPLGGESFLYGFVEDISERLRLEEDFLSLVTDIRQHKDIEEQLRQSEERARRQLDEIQTYYDTAPVGLFAMDQELRYLRINERMAAVNGLPAAAHLGRTLREMAPYIADSAEPRFRQVLASGEPLLNVEHREPTPDRPGVPRVWLESTYPVRNAAGQVIGISGVVEDITELKHAEEQWRTSEALARRRLEEIQAYYDTAPIGLCVLDRDLRFLRINDRLAQINGLPIAAHLGRTVREALPSLADTVEPLFQRILTTGEPLLNLEITGETLAQPGVPRVWREHFYPLKDVAGQVIGINVTVEEITALKQAERQLRISEQRYRELSAELELKVQERTLELRNANGELHRLATTDSLTGVWNRRYLEQAVAGEMARAQRYGEPLALVMFDIDHFKAINDRHGHLVGDHVLIEMAQRIRGHLRASDLLARWGGEEFVILLPHSTAPAAARLAEKLRLATMMQPFPTAGTITTSFGVAEYQPDDTLDGWFTRADNALYAAKEAGRNRVVIAA